MNKPKVNKLKTKVQCEPFILFKGQIFQLENWLNGAQPKLSVAQCDRTATTAVSMQITCGRR